MVINTNISAMSSARLLAGSTTSLSKSLARLSSGSKLNSPEDDAAGLAQSMKFEAQINRNNACNANVGNAISFSQTQDGFLQKVQKSLDRMSELSVLAQDVTKTDTDRSNYSTEFVQLQNYISDIGSKTFNGVSLFATSNYNAVDLGVTINSDGQTFAMAGADFVQATSLAPSNYRATGLASIFATTTGGSGLTAGVSIYGQSVTVATITINGATTNAGIALTYIKTAIQTLANMRAQVGANIQRLNLTSEQLTILNENLSSANSRIKDVDVAEESTAFARYNILVQSGTAMLAQANTLPQAALRLLG